MGGKGERSVFHVHLHSTHRYGIIHCGDTLTHSHKMTPFDAPGKPTFKKNVGKREMARYEQFLFFPQCFLPV